MTNLLEHCHITLVKEALDSKHGSVPCSRESMGTAIKPWYQESAIVLAKHFPSAIKNSWQLLFQLYLTHNFFLIWDV